MIATYGEAAPLATFTDIEDELWQSVLSCPAPWHVFHLRSRTEKSVKTKAEQYVGGELVTLLPLFTKAKKYQRRLVKSQLPLFPGYLFVRSEEGAAREFASRTNEVVNCLPVVNQNEFEHSMIQIARLV